MAPRNPQFSLYLPRAVLTWDLGDGEGPARTVEGTLMFADLSGFTALVERVGAQGRAGAEDISEQINGVFERVLSVVRDEGGDVLKFGGDASLVLFSGPGHELSAALAALDIQDVMAELPSFGISIGLESGPVELVMVGDRFRDLLVVGGCAQGVLRAEKEAQTGEIVVGSTLARRLPAGTVDADGRLDADPDELADLLGDDVHEQAAPGAGDQIDLADFVPVGLRESLTVAGTYSEHRHVATGFVHAALDPDAPVPVEALAELVEALTDSCERHGVALLNSDVEIGGIKFLLCAGAPSASHHEEERMLRAARRVLDTVDDLPLRAGVTRGLVFAGDFGASWRRYYTLLGDSVNLAARLMSAAQPGQLLTLDNVVDRSPTRFTLERLEPVHLKGKSKPVRPIAVGGITGVERVDWARYLPLTGRDDEVDTAERALAAARSGAGGTIEIVGESGAGKSRLLGELLDRSSIVDTYLVVCEQYEASTPFFAAGHLLRGVLGLKPDADNDEQVTRLGDAALEWPDLAPWLPLIGIPLGLDLPETDATSSLAEEFRVPRMHQVVIDLVRRLRTEVTVMAVEDAHWMDDASCALFEGLAAVAGELPWLLALTLRPAEGTAPSTEGATRIELPPLDEAAATDLVRLAAREMPASDEAIRSIVETSGGHPFFALELLRHADESSLPDTVEAVVAERIDRLDARDRQLLRFVSVLGNSFSLELLAKALPEVAGAAEDAGTWNRLSDFLDVTVFGTVQFKQDLIRVAAYEGLVYRRRHEIHALVGEALERQSRRRLGRQAPLLSQHFHLAQRWDKSARYSRLAAEQALRKGASGEAVRLYERTVEALEQADATETAVDGGGSELAEVQEALGDAALLAGRLDIAGAAFRSSIETLGSAASTEQRLRSARRLASVERDRGELTDAGSVIHQALAAAGPALSAAEDAEAIECLVTLAGVEHRAGHFEQAEDTAFEAMARAEEAGAGAAFARAAMVRIANLEYLGREPERDLVAEAMAVYAELGDAHGMAKVLNNSGLTAFFRADWERALADWTAAEEHYRTAGDAIGAATARNNLGELLSDQGRLAEAEDEFLDALRSWRAAGFRTGVALASLNLGRLEARRRRRAEALELFDVAAEEFAAVGYESYLEECALRRAELFAYLGEPAQVAALIAERGDDVGEGPLRSLHRRLTAYALLATQGDGACTAAKREGSTVAELSIALDEAASASGSGYEAALVDRLRADALGDDEARERSAAALSALGAARAIVYRVPGPGA